MLFSPSANLAYFHIHKTGGKSIRAFFLQTFPDAVEIGDREHLDSLGQAFDLLSQKNVDSRKVRIFTSIRDPFAHVVSIYHFWRSVKDEAPIDHVRAAKALSFAEFVGMYCSDFRVYENYLCLDGVLPPNLCVIRLERAEEELDFYLNRVLKLGIRINLPVLNRSTHDSVDGHYNTVTKRLVARHYAWVFEQGWYPLSKAQRSAAAARRAATVARQEVEMLRGSISYRLGRILSWPLRAGLAPFVVGWHMRFRPIVGWALASFTTPALRLIIKQYVRTALQ